MIIAKDPGFFKMIAQVIENDIVDTVRKILGKLCH